jgi:SSS family transporter
VRGADLAVIAVYFIAMIAVGIAVTRHQRTAGDYFLGSRDLPAWTVLLSIVATETSALTVISVPGIGARGDLTFMQLPLGYLLGRIVVARWLLPGYFTGRQETAYARLERRFGTGTRRLLSGIFLVTRFLGDGVRVYAGAIPLSLVTGWTVPTAILAIGGITLVYTLLGGLKAVVWTDVIQLVVYVAGGIAVVVVAAGMAGGVGPAFTAAAAAGKLRLIDPRIDFTRTYTLLGGLLGGALLSMASHGTDHLIVQRLLATRSEADARRALIGSGIVVIGQFLLFLLAGIMIWAAGQAAPELKPDAIFPSFVTRSLPTGLAGLVIAGILAAAMSTHSSAINALASALTHDFYVGLTGRTDPEHLLRVGRVISFVWGVLLTLAAWAFVRSSSGSNTPAVVLALSIASVTYGALLGTYVLAGLANVGSRDVRVATVVTVAVMLVVVFAKELAALPGAAALAPVGRLAWPWYVPLGTALAVTVGWLASRLHPPLPTPSNEVT